MNFELVQLETGGGNFATGNLGAARGAKGEWAAGCSVSAPPRWSMLDSIVLREYQVAQIASSRPRGPTGLVIPGRASWREPGIHNHHCSFCTRGRPQLFHHYGLWLWFRAHRGACHRAALRADPLAISRNDEKLLPPELPLQLNLGALEPRTLRLRQILSRAIDVKRQHRQRRAVGAALAP